MEPLYTITIKDDNPCYEFIDILIKAGYLKMVCYLSDDKKEYLIHTPEEKSVWDNPVE